MNLSDENDPLLEVSHVAGGYGDLQVLWDISLTVRPGSISLLLGRNGVGKTTTLRVIAGLNRATAGTIRLKGSEINGLTPAQRVRRGVGYVQEGKRIFRRRTVEENLWIGGYSRGIPRRRMPQEAEAIYEVFPMLAERRRFRAGALSGGQQQMLAIGQALMAAPSLLMLDEPSAGLAPTVFRDTMAAVEKLRQQGIGVLLVEQAVDAIEFADRVTVVDVGRVVKEGAREDMSEIDLLKGAYFGTESA